jgi:chitinase
MTGGFMRFSKNKNRCCFQLFPIFLMVFSLLFSCKNDSTGPSTSTTTAGSTTTTTLQVAEIDSSSNAVIDLADSTFILSNNDWGFSSISDECDQAIILYSDDSYGWEWSRGSTGDDEPNYPEVICGTKPWGTRTGAEIFPVQIKDLNSFESDMEVVYGVEGDNWNLAFEFWLTEQKPEGNDVSGSIIDEVMIWLGWGSAHSGVSLIEQDAVVDGGNIYDYARYFPGHGSGWDYHQFRISGEQRVPSGIDLKLFVDYIKDRYSRSDTLWVSGMELGNEYWDFTEGACTVKALSYSVNGETVISGSD